MIPKFRDMKEGMRTTRLVFVLALLIPRAGGLPLFSQEDSQIQQLTPLLSRALSNVPELHIAVAMPSPCIRQLSSCSKLDAIVRAALVATDRDLRIVPEDALTSALTAQGFLPVDRYFPAAVTRVTRNLNANILIEYKVTGDNRVSILVYEQREFEEFGARLSGDAAPLPPIWVDPESGISIKVEGSSDPGKSFKMPSCLACASPNFSFEARKKGIEGTVSMLATVSVNGRPKDLVAVSGLGHELDEQAVKAVKNWRFTPARDPNGQTLEMRVPVEITFRLLN